MIYLIYYFSVDVHKKIEHNIFMQVNQSLKKKILKKIGLNIKLYRLKANFSQENLAFEIGVDRTYISAIELGIKSPSLYCLYLLSQKLGVPFKELFDIKI